MSATSILAEVIFQSAIADGSYWAGQAPAAYGAGIAPSGGAARLAQSTMMIVDYMGANYLSSDPVLMRVPLQAASFDLSAADFLGTGKPFDGITGTAVCYGMMVDVQTNSRGTVPPITFTLSGTSLNGRPISNTTQFTIPTGNSDRQIVRTVVLPWYQTNGTLPQYTPLAIREALISGGTTLIPATAPAVAFTGTLADVTVTYTPLVRGNAEFDFLIGYSAAHRTYVEGGAYRGRLAWAAQQGVQGSYLSPEAVFGAEYANAMDNSPLLRRINN